jgi:N-acetylglucosaminyldiphosphoundecaprenol N-acetyl-beta-D-mannosaminyltransferase
MNDQPGNIECPNRLDQPAISNIVDLNVSASNFEGNFKEIVERARAGRGGRVVTLNMEMVARHSMSDEYKDLLDTADLIVADGVPIVWLSKVAKANRRIDGRTNGTDLVEAILTRKYGAPVSIIGGRDATLLEKSLELPPGRVVHLEPGRIDETDLDTLLSDVGNSGAMIALVALGVPKQDIVSAAICRAHPHIVTISVGGALDLLTGVTPRAPRWMQNSGLEWFFRLITEPRRLTRRYVVIYPLAVYAAFRWMIER